MFGVARQNRVDLAPGPVEDRDHASDRLRVVRRLHCGGAQLHRRVTQLREGRAFRAFVIVPSLSGARSASRYWANTKELDNLTALYNHGMRYYDPVTGRYLTRDPLGYADGRNPYLYVHDNPINTSIRWGCSAMAMRTH